MIVATLLFVALFIERGHCQTYLGAASERSADLGDVISDALSDAVEDAVETSALNSDTMINLVPPTLTSIPGSTPYRSTNKGISSNSQGGNYVPQSAQQTSSGGKYADNDGTHLGYNKNFENNYTPADILPRTESNSAINYGGSHARNSGTRATDANSNGGNYAPAATTPWIQAEYIAGNGGNYGSSGRAQSSYNSNHGDIHAQTSPPLHTSTNYASNYGNGYGSISGSPTPYYSSNNNKPNTPTSTRGQLFSSFTNTAGGVFINANNAVGSNNIGCAIVVSHYDH
ncbi:unnamed protein product [Toxocara canis]|uniref:Secreted protein n=1 Tax=Toxocara canis TaxID=6265 RepID=A0A183V738_TOXCA|nr:unnamed protein product [Toxocara canis]